MLNQPSGLYCRNEGCRVGEVMISELILVINPGSTSTKVAIYEGDKELDALELKHSAKELAQFHSINDQMEFRKAAVLGYLSDKHIDAGELSAIACRGGVVGQLESGAYLVDKSFAEASLNSPAPHPANLSPVIGYEIAREVNERSGAADDSTKALKAYVYDAVCGCGRPTRVFTITGIAEIEKPFLTHVLNSRAVSIEQARRDGVMLHDTTYIVTHLGGGITTNLIKAGKVMDFVGDDEGGLSPERSGGLPVRPLVKLCYSGKFDEKEMQKKLKGEGGLMAYLGTNDLREVERRMDQGDETARLVFDAMVLQIAKDIGSLATVVCGKVDKIILTGGMAYSKAFTGELKERVGFLAPVSIIPGTFEMEALAHGVLRVLHGEEQARVLEK